MISPWDDGDNEVSPHEAEDKGAGEEEVEDGDPHPAKDDDDDVDYDHDVDDNVDDDDHIENGSTCRSWGGNRGRPFHCLKSLI